MTDDAKPAKIPTLEPSPDYEMNVNPDDSSKVMLIATIVILVVAIAGAVIAIAPKVKNNAAQKEKIQQLEAQLAAVKRREAQAQAARQAQPSGVEQQLSAVQSKMAELQSSLVNGDMQTKINDLQTKFSQMAQQSQTIGLVGMMAKIQNLQQTPEGAAMISSLVGSLAASPNDAGEQLEALRSVDPNVAQVTEGVRPEDMKAAAMLIALTQLRHSLQRSNDSFDQDLALLKKTLPEDSVELRAAIDRLAPQAKYGVLTNEGLSQELRGLTGDIVSAGLSGQDVSIQDKAKARIANLVTVEKNGVRISGTQEQIAIAAAQKQLDAGNVQGAVDILQTIKGPAADKTQPFLEQAQATLLAGNVQNNIAQTIVQTIKGSLAGVMNGGMPTGVVNPGLSSITNQIQAISPVPLPSAPPAVAPVR